MQKQQTKTTNTEKHLICIYFPLVIHSEKADLKSRTDLSAGMPPLDSIYTTATGGGGGFHHQHHQHNGLHHQGSPEAMKVRMAAMILQPPTRV